MQALISRSLFGLFNTRNGHRRHRLRSYNHCFNLGHRLVRREGRAQDLPRLMELYAQLNPDSSPLDNGADRATFTPQRRAWLVKLLGGGDGEQ